MPRNNHELLPLVEQAIGWAKFVISGLGSIAIHFASKYWEAIRDSHPWSLYQAAKDNDAVRVRVRAEIRPIGVFLLSIDLPSGSQRIVFHTE